MATFLFKTEPGEFSFADLERASPASWDGISNAAANAHLRTCAVGDEVLIYHTGDEKAIVGLARVTGGPAADPANPARLASGEIKFVVVTLEALRGAKTPVTLAAIKADARFKDFPLVTQGRLSVMPVPSRLDRVLRTMAGL